VQNVKIGVDSSPFVIRSCVLRKGGQGIAVAGSPAPAGPSQGVCVRGNHISGLQEGLQISGYVRDVQVVGNVIHECGITAIDVEDFAADSRNVLLANNTAFASSQVFRIADNEPYEPFHRGQAEVTGNLFFQASSADMLYILFKPGTRPTPKVTDEVIRTWRFRSNWRDLSGSDSSRGIPFDKTAFQHLSEKTFLSSERWSPDFLRPAADSPLATGGAGKDDPSLPLYVGAVPPKGVEPWDWDKTWRWRMSRPKSQSPKPDPKP
jgi:hypothetical protein